MRTDKTVFKSQPVFLDAGEYGQGILNPAVPIQC
jgi:hypothetical protein